MTPVTLLPVAHIWKQLVLELYHMSLSRQTIFRLGVAENVAAPSARSAGQPPLHLGTTALSEGPR